MAYSNQSYSSFWMDDDFTFEDYDVLTGVVKKNKGKDLFKLASYKRAISNFVRITTGKEIPVSYSTKDSYTDGTSIVLSAGMNDKDFDPNVGLALHEASHIKLTDFNLLTQLMGNTERTYPEIYKAIQKLDSNGKKSDLIDASKLDTIKDLLNYVEDRRIDLFMFKSAPGYKGYYLSMYDKYFHARVIDKALQSNKKRSETWDSYMFRIINLTNPNRDLTALKGLKEIYKAIGFTNIARLKTTQDALDVAFEIFQIVEKYIKKDKKKQSEGMGGSCKKCEQTAKMKTPGGQAKSEENTDDQIGNNSDFTTIDGELTPTSNLSGFAKELTDSQKRQLEKAIAKQEKFQNDTIKKSKLAKSDEKKLEAITESGSEIKNVGKNVNANNYWGSGAKQIKGTEVLVVDKITDSVIENGIYQNITSPDRKYAFGRYCNDEDIKAAIILGKLLGKKLKMRNEERSTIYSRLGNGKIDKRLISALGHGYERVFYNVETDKFNNASIHISIDGSGSMSGDKFRQTAKATIAIATAAKMIQGLDVTISYRTTENIGNTDTAAIFILYKSKRDSIKRLYKIMPLLTLNGTTPEGLCFEAIQKLIVQGNDNYDSYFINLSDGQPYFGSKGYTYSGNPAYRHTKRQCDNMRANGVKILSYFISSSGDPSNSDKSDFKKMYGNDSAFVNCTGLASLAKTLNQMFLTK